jgi:hypothetical protein
VGEEDGTFFSFKHTGKTLEESIQKARCFGRVAEVQILEIPVVTP